MAALPLDGFEAMIKATGVVAFKKSAPLKTTEEIRADWLAQRMGRFTASQFYRLMTCINKSELPDGAKTYVNETVAECLVIPGSSDGYVSAEMQWGIDNEAAAVAAFVAATGLSVSAHGSNQVFIEYGDHAGATPDGMMINAGLELKCPKSVTHLGYLKIKTTEDLKSICPNYYWQVQGSMMITGLKRWYFASYDPRFVDAQHQLHIVEIVANEADIEQLKIRLAMAIVLKKFLLEQLGVKKELAVIVAPIVTLDAASEDKEKEDWCKFEAMHLVQNTAKYLAVSEYEACERLSLIDWLEIKYSLLQSA